MFLSEGQTKLPDPFIEPDEVVKSTKTPHDDEFLEKAKQAYEGK